MSGGLWSLIDHNPPLVGRRGGRATLGRVRRPLRRPAALALLTALALSASACGGGNTGTGPAGGPTASAPDAPPPPTDATQPGTGPVTTPTTTGPAGTQTAPAGGGGGSGTGDGSGTGGGSGAGGGAEPVRVPASFTVASGGRLIPPTITVPPFLAVEVSVRSDDGKPHRLVVQTSPPQTLQVAAGRRAAVRIAGLRAGRYPVTLDGRRAGALVAGGEVGP